MIYSFEDYEVDTSQQELRKAGVAVKIEPQVFDLIQLLVQHHERLVSKDEIVEKIWGGRAISDTAISSRISSARAALGDDGRQQRLIKTVHNKGLRFLATPSTNGAPVAYSRLTNEGSPSILVLPLKARLSEEMEALTAESLADEITTLLTGLEGLKVVPRYAVGRNLQPDADPLELARGIGAQYVVSGSVRREGDRLRVRTELTNLDENRQVWSDKFDSTMADIFTIQDDIAKGVVGVLGGKIARIEAARAVRRPPESLQAWELARRAHAVPWDWRPKTMAQAIEDCRRAIKLDPGYAHAHVYQGLYISWQIAQGWHADPVTGKTEALYLAERALRLAPDDAEVLSAVGDTYRLTGQLYRARDFYEDAIDRNADIFAPWPFALLLIGVCYAQLGDTDRAIMLIQAFEGKFPRNDLGRLWSRVILGYVELCRGDYEKVAVLHANPPSEYNAMCGLIALMKLNQTDKAISDYARLKSENPAISLPHYIDHFKTFHIDLDHSASLSAALVDLQKLVS